MTLESLLKEAFPQATWLEVDALAMGAFPEWDSIGHFNFLLLVEERTGVQLTLEEIESGRSLKALQQILRNRGIEISLS